jgi:5'-phosphate synthase pdxT subunit
MTWLLKREGLFDALRKAAERLPVFATCAGLILLGKGVRDPRVEQLELLDITVERNGYGAQVDSFEGRVQLADGGIIEGVFIRAPKIKAVGPSVTVLGTCEGEPVLVQQGNILAASFHPELGGDLLLHKMLLSLKLGHSQRF